MSPFSMSIFVKIIAEVNIVRQISPIINDHPVSFNRRVVIRSEMSDNSPQWGDTHVQESYVALQGLEVNAYWLSNPYVWGNCFLFGIFLEEFR